MKPSIKTQEVKRALGQSVQPSFSPCLDVERVRVGQNPNPPQELYEEFVIDEVKIGEARYISVTPQCVRSDLVLVYFHGGAYVGGIKDYYWPFVQQIADRLGITVVVSDYRLTPEHSVGESLSDAIMTLDEVRKSFSTDRLVIMGDSAGAGLSMASFYKLRESEQVLPEGMVLISPWLDVRMKNPGIDADLEARDQILAVPGLKEAGVHYAGQLGVDHHYVSPINGDLSELPPMLLQIGTDDLFFPDCELFKTRAESAGGDIQYEVAEHMPHCWVLLGDMLPEAGVTVDSIVKLVQDRFIAKA